MKLFFTGTALYRLRSTSNPLSISRSGGSRWLVEVVTVYSVSAGISATSTQNFSPSQKRLGSDSRRNRAKMHPALLVDEILQLIFEINLDDEKSSLCRAARCCKAWKDPALDRIWRRLPSAVPLLSLLPGCSVEKGTIVRPQSKFALCNSGN
jgi:hypothetical protein